jgi:NAD(P)-dependent dehydrogenase (short-subunit alcohol dehydrogenase family)
VRRWAEPEELAATCVFLADPTQTFHTGDEVRVDGGYSIY